MPRPLPEFVWAAGKKKYWIRGEKRYAPVIEIGNRGFYLRVHWETATDALEYGEKVVERYQRLLRAYVERTPVDIELECQLDELALNGL